MHTRLTALSRSELVRRPPSSDPMLDAGYTLDFFLSRAYQRPVTLGASWTRNQAAAQRAGEAAWHAGRTEVWVDPGDPAQATLDPASGAALLRPVLFAIIGVALVAFAVHRWRSAKASAA